MKQKKFISKMLILNIFFMSVDFYKSNLSQFVAILNFPVSSDIIGIYGSTITLCQDKSQTKHLIVCLMLRCKSNFNTVNFLCDLMWTSVTCFARKHGCICRVYINRIVIFESPCQQTYKSPSWSDVTFRLYPLLRGMIHHARLLV